MRTFERVFFPPLPGDPDDALCERFQHLLHERLDRNQFGEVRIGRSGPGVAVTLRVLDESKTDDDIDALIAEAWQSFDKPA